MGIDVGGGDARGALGEVKDWVRARIAEALRTHIGRTWLFVNGTAVAARHKIDVQMSGATGEDHPELDLVRAILPAGALPRCSVIVNHASFGTGATTLDLISTQFDSDGWADLTANTITVSDEGDYLIHSFISWGFPGGTDPTTGTFRRLLFSFSGGILAHYSEQDPPRLLVGGDQQGQETMTFRHLPAGTVITVQAQHDATGNMIVSGGSAHPNDLTVVKLG